MRITYASGVMKFNFRADRRRRIAPRFPPRARVPSYGLGNLAITRKRDRNNYSARNLRPRNLRERRARK
jgi:hypothetical protein